MTKEEFENIINAELDKLQAERDSAKQKVEYFSVIAPGSREYIDAKNALNFITEKINRLRECVQFPAYARIQAMSDVEIEHYKEEKVAELETKISELESKIEEAKAELAQLKAEQDLIVSKFGSLSEEEKNAAIDRGRRIRASIMSYEDTSNSGKIRSIELEIEEIRKQQEKIKKSTSQEIKYDLCSKIKGKVNIDYLIKRASLSSDQELLAAVSADPEKVHEMANCILRYYQLSSEQDEIKATNLYLPRTLPNALDEKLRFNRFYCYDDCSSKNPKGVVSEIETYEKTFEEAKNEFFEEFTEEKLFGIATWIQGESDSVDMEFLRMHEDKTKSGLQTLQSLVERKNMLSNKVFKTKNVKWEIDSLNQKIYEEEKTVYNQIMSWYQTKYSHFCDILGIKIYMFFTFNFHTVEVIQSQLKNARESIEESLEAIAEAKQIFVDAQAYVDEMVGKYEEAKEKLATRIRTLAGPQFANAPNPAQIPSVYGRSTDVITKTIHTAGTDAYTSKVVDKVQTEAQNQADATEAELRGVSLEELKQMKEQALAAANTQANPTTLAEEVDNTKPLEFKA